MALVPNEEGSVRFYVDYRRINVATVPDTYQMTRMEALLDRLGYLKVLDKLDYNYGNWKIEILSEDQDNTYFTYRYSRMSFRIRNASYTFQRVIDVIISGVRWKMYLVYLDEVIKLSMSVEELVALVDEVFSLIGSERISLKLNKLFLFKYLVDYLGSIWILAKP